MERKFIWYGPKQIVSQFCAKYTSSPKEPQYESIEVKQLAEAEVQF